MPYQTGDEPLQGFKLVRSLGCGSCGEVWQAAHVSGISAALKIIPLLDQDAGRWLPAILEIKNVRHPHVLEINRTWLRDSQGKLFGLTQARPLPGWDLIIVMELAARSLWDRLQECKKSQSSGIDRPELMDYMQKAAKGLDYLNCQGIVHGAVKPRNLLLHGGKVKVSDSGHAGLIRGEPRSAGQDLASSRVYSSPEGLRKEMHRTSDQYGLAVSYYEMLTGKLPFEEAASASEIQKAIAEGRLAPSELPEGEQAMFAKATHLDPGQRYPSVVKFIESLQIAQSNTPTRWPSGAFHRPVK